MSLPAPTDAPAATTDTSRVRAAIALLPPLERDLLVLRYGSQCTTAELAAATHVSPATVHERLHHAAWVVQDEVGAVPAAGEATRLLDRPMALVEEDATLGITPLLAARIAAAVADGVPAADERWRLHDLVRRVRSHTEGLLTALLGAAALVPMAASLLGA